MCRVLVVDDNWMAAEVLVDILGELHEVRVAHDSEAALATARDFVPQVVLLDLAMPVVSGYEIARRLRKLLGSDVKLVAFTGLIDVTPEDIEAAGLDGLVRKPATIDSLLDAVESSSRREARRQNG